MPNLHYFPTGKSARKLAVATAGVLSSFVLSQAAHAQHNPSNWVTSGNGDFSNPTNWSTNPTIPGQEDFAVFNAAGVNANETVYLDTASQTLWGMVFNSTGSTTMLSGTVAGGPSTAEN